MPVPTVIIDSIEFPVYADLETATAYAVGSLNATEWTALDDDAKKVALVSATRVLDRQRWRSDCDTFEKRLEKQNIVDASVEIAFALAAGSDLQDAQNQSQKIEMLRAGSVQLRFFRGADGKPLRFPLIIQELIRDCLASAGGKLARGSVAFGTDKGSATDEDFGYSGSI